MSTDQLTGNDPRELLSIQAAAKELGVNRIWLAGHLAGLKIRLKKIGPSLVVSRRDLRKVQPPTRRPRRA